MTRHRARNRLRRRRSAVRASRTARRSRWQRVRPTPGLAFAVTPHSEQSPSRRQDQVERQDHPRHAPRGGDPRRPAVPGPADDATNVVYLTEQTPGPFREALTRAVCSARRGAAPRVPGRRGWRAVAEARRHGGRGREARRLRPARRRHLGKLAQVQEENDAGEGGRVMVPLQDAAHAGMAVIVCRHERKGGGDVGESGRGSSAIRGDVDVILQLRRPEGN